MVLLRVFDMINDLCLEILVEIAFLVDLCSKCARWDWLCMNLVFARCCGYIVFISVAFSIEWGWGLPKGDTNLYLRIYMSAYQLLANEQV